MCTNTLIAIITCGTIHKLAEIHHCPRRPARTVNTPTSPGGRAALRWSQFSTSEAGESGRRLLTCGTGGGRWSRRGDVLLRRTGGDAGTRDESHQHASLYTLRQHWTGTGATSAPPLGTSDPHLRWTSEQRPVLSCRPFCRREMWAAVGDAVYCDVCEWFARLMDQSLRGVARWLNWVLWLDMRWDMTRLVLGCVIITYSRVGLLSYRQMNIQSVWSWLCSDKPCVDLSCLGLLLASLVLL